MKNWVFAFVVLVGFVACKNKPIQLEKVEDKPIEPQEVEKQEVEYVFRPSEYYSKFKFHNLKAYKIDKSNSIEFDSFMKLDSLEWRTILQDDLTQFSDYDSFYFYSNYSDSTKITLLEQSDEKGLFIWLLKFDNLGKLICKEELANFSGDSDSSCETYGQFEKQRYIRTDLFFKQTDDNNIVGRDSVILKLTFLPNGKVKSDTLFHENRIIKER